MADLRKNLKISPEAHKTLRKLADLSGQDVNAIVEEWLASCQKVLDSFGSGFSRISLMSAFYEKDRLAISYIAPIFTGQFRIPECLDEDTKDLVSDRFLRLDVDEKLRKRKKVVKD
jgi:hypothetical protein